MVALTQGASLGLVRAILKLTHAASASASTQEIAQTACQLAVDELGVSHSGFVLFDLENKWAHVMAESRPSLETVGRRFKVDGVAAEHLLLTQRQPINAPDVDACEELGPIRKLLGDLGIVSILVVPVVGRSRVLGSFSLDAVGVRRSFSDVEVAFCQCLASQIAMAMEAKHAAAQTEALRRASLSIAMHQDRQTLLQAMVNEATRLLGASGGGFYRYDQNRRVLTLVVDKTRPHLVGTQLPLEEGMAGRLTGEALRGGRSYSIVNDYATSDLRATRFQPNPFGAVLEVVVGNGSNLLGILYVDDPPSRAFVDSDAELLGALAGPAALALTNVERLEERRRVDQLVAATQPIDDAHEELRRLADALVRVLRVDYCRIWLADHALRSLTVKAAARVSRTQGSRHWDPELDNAIPLTKMSELRDILTDGAPALWLGTDPRAKHHVQAVSDRLQFGASLTSIVLVPIHVDGQAVGLLEFGRIGPHDHEAERFLREDLPAINAFANRIGVQLDQLRVALIDARTGHHLTTLERIGHELKGERRDHDLRHLAVKLACELLGWEKGALYVNHAHLGVLTLNDGPYYPCPLPDEVQHRQGLVGCAAVEPAGALIATEGSGSDLWEPSFTEVNLRIAMAVPIVVDGRVDSVLLMGTRDGSHLLLASERKAAEQLAARVAAALFTSRRMRLSELMLAMTTYVQEISTDDILNTLCQTVTMPQGLGFGRAVVFLRAQRDRRLVGRSGIGDYRKPMPVRGGEEACEPTAASYRALLAKGSEATHTELGLWASRVAIPRANADLFYDVLAQRQPCIVPPNAAETLPAAYRDTLQPTSSTIIVPLVARDHALGLLVVDAGASTLPQAVSADDLNDLVAFASAAAAAFDNRVLRDQTEAGHQQLQRLFEASNQLVLPDSPELARRALAASSLYAYRHSIATVLVVRDDAGALVAESAGECDNALRDLLAVSAETHSALEFPRPIRLEDLTELEQGLSRHQFARGGTLLALPMVAEGRALGVLWILYRARREFSAVELEALWLYANQAGLAYLNATRVEDLRRHREAFERMSAHVSPAQVRDEIVAQARRVLGAEAAILWSYDPKQARFTMEPLAATGISDAVNPPRARRLTDHVRKHGYVLIEDLLERTRFREIDDEEREFFVNQGMRSVQAIPLAGRDGCIAVLYLCHLRPRQYDLSARQQFDTFAGYAALALDKALAFEQISQIHEATRSLAKLITFADVRTTIEHVARQIAPVIGCSAVTVYAYDETKEDFVYPPATHEVWQETLVSEAPRLPTGSLVRRMLTLSGPWGIPEVSKEPAFAESQFWRREQVVSCIVLPLTAQMRRVGVMFLNWRESRQFSDSELQAASLFGHLAAVAILNSQLYHELHDSAKRFTKSLATVAHQLGGLHHAVQHRASNLRDGVYAPLTGGVKDCVDELMSLIYEETRLLANMLDSVLIRERRFALKLMRTRLSGQLDAAIRHQEYDATKKGLRIVKRYDVDDPLTLLMDGAKICMAVSNLLANAIRASSNGDIIVEARRRGEEVTVSVSDPGPGLPPDIEVFTQFFCRDAHGTGIGLSVAKDYVVLHHGTITHRSEDGRTVFEFTLPLDASAKEPS